MSNSNIQQAFARGKAFIGFLTAGDPSLERSEEFALEMARGGADLVEIGIPFSDPIAEGAVIQRANIRALSAGTTIEKIFALARRVRQRTPVPLVFLTYLNPVFRYGYGAFFARCAETGVSGIIIPDLPFEEQVEARVAASAHGVEMISLVAPTSERRIQLIASSAEGFLYVVSSLGVTGIRSEIKTDLAAIVASARAASKIPVAVGFGINTPEQAAAIARVADGVIVGSAIVRLVEEHGANAGKPVYEYVRKMKAAVSA